MAAPKLLIPYSDYQRIFKVMYSVLDGRAIVESSCIFFSFAGAAILKRFYGLDANPVAGAALYCVDTADAFVVTFGRFENDILVSSQDAFHAWVECDGYAIDFMAPLFVDSMASRGVIRKIPRKMFQKPLATTAANYIDLAREGSFVLQPDLATTADVAKTFFSRHAGSDLANVCMEWYARPPKRIPEVLTMADDRGELTKLRLHGPEISGVW